jgi:RNA polymerase sigma factor (sigma-70 family)
MPNQPHSQSAEPSGRRSHILDDLLTNHRGALLRHALKHSKLAADAEDALHDACVRFLRHYDGPPDTDALRWMMFVTKRCAWAIGARPRIHESLRWVNATDAQRGPALIAEADPALDPAQICERREQQRTRVAALACLKRDERTALVLFGLGLSYKEIASRKQWTQTKVNRCIAEGRAALREQISAMSSSR